MDDTRQSSQGLDNRSFNHELGLFENLIYGYDGTNARALKVNAEGSLDVDIDMATEGLVQVGTTPTIYNITMTNADTQYSQALPANTKKITIQCRTGFDIRFAFEANKVATPTEPYMTLKSGAVYFEDNLNLTSKTLYVACGTAGKSVEVIVWA